MLGVVKAYTTRVGTGPLPTEMDAPMARARPRRSATSSARRPAVARRCGWFDAVVVRYATRINGLTDVAVTKLDVLDTLDRIAICTGYEYDGDLHTEFPGDITVARPGRAAVRVDGRMAAARRATRAGSTDLPAQARAYLDRLHELIETRDHVRQRRHAARSDHRAMKWRTPSTS